MGRPAASLGLDAGALLFAANELPLQAKPREPNFASLRNPVWSEEKATLIQTYLRYFTYVTKHGVYIDGFAAPQRRDLPDLCSAKLVLDAEPKRIRDIWLCDIADDGVALLEGLAAEHRSNTRRVTVVSGDFNVTVHEILKSDRIRQRTATFALLDQRGFECAWDTVGCLAAHKPSLGPCETKIELFYFLATGWLDRSIASVQRPAKIAEYERWWGRPDWPDLGGMQGIPRANLVARRFTEELGYASARAYAIHDRKQGGRIMYHMIHATDHPDAPQLMLRAYRKVSGREDIDLEAAQVSLDEFWQEAEG